MNSSQSSIRAFQSLPLDRGSSALIADPDSTVAPAKWTVRVAFQFPAE